MMNTPNKPTKRTLEPHSETAENCCRINNINPDEQLHILQQYFLAAVKAQMTINDFAELLINNYKATFINFDQEEQDNITETLSRQQYLRNEDNKLYPIPVMFCEIETLCHLFPAPESFPWTPKTTLFNHNPNRHQAINEAFNVFVNATGLAKHAISQDRITENFGEAHAQLCDILLDHFKELLIEEGGIPEKTAIGLLRHKDTINLGCLLPWQKESHRLPATLNTQPLPTMPRP